jgi:hypothetical protein
MAKPKLTWTTLDTTAFTGNVAKAWKAHQDAQAKAKAITDPTRKALETAVEAQLRAKSHLQPDQDAVFGYLFGGLGFAPKPKATKGASKMVL